MTEQEAIQATRERFAQISRDCVTRAQNGEWRVNDLPSYVEWQNSLAQDAMDGKHDHTFTFRQYSHMLLTGECIPFLSP